MVFSASLDRMAKRITALITILFLALIVYQVYIFREGASALAIGVTIFLVVLYLMVWLFSPGKYEVTNRALIIHRAIGRKVVPLSSITEISPVSTPMSKSLRVGGVGGLFGYFGRFTSPTFGKMTWYATRRDKFVLLKTNTGRGIVVTPDEPEDFILRIEKVREEIR